MKSIPSIAVLFVATMAPLGAMTDSSLPLPSRSIVKLLPDYLRPRVYALNGGAESLPGTLLALNPTNGSVISEISLGMDPTDMAMGPGGEALYVINTGSRTLMKIDLSSFSVNGTRSITTPGTYNPANTLHIAVGRSNIVYFTDGAWAPLVYIYDFLSGAVIGEYNDGNGVGGLAATRDGTTLYTWRQFGWSAGNVNSWVTRLDARTSNALTPLETSFVSWRRDPFDTPILLNAAETVVFNKQQMFAATNVSILLNSFSENIYAISLDGTVAFGPTRLFNSYNGFVITNFSFSSTVQSLSGDQRRLFRYQAQPSELHIYDMTELASVSGPSPQPQPTDGEVVALPPTNLVWSPSPFALTDVRII